MKHIKVEWCENFIRGQFSERHHAFAGNPVAGIEVNLFFHLAEAAGLWIRGTYGSPMSQALEKLCIVESVLDTEGEFAYNVFRLKPCEN